MTPQAYDLAIESIEAVHEAEGYWLRLTLRSGQVVTGPVYVRDGDLIIVDSYEDDTPKGLVYISLDSVETLQLAA